MKNYKYHKERYIKLIIIGTIITTFFWFKLFSNRLYPKVLAMAIIESDNQIYKLLNQIVNESSKNINKKNLLEFQKNSNNEILVTQYNLEEVYDLLNDINNKIILKKKDFTFFLPAGMISNHFLLNNWGSKIPIRSKITNNVYSNIKTKVTNYGLNNALVEMYIVLEVHQQIISPFKKTDDTRKYEILISTFFINGKVPNFYGQEYVKNSNIFDISQKI